MTCMATVRATWRKITLQLKRFLLKMASTPTLKFAPFGRWDAPSAPLSYTLGTHMNDEPQNLNIPLERNEHWGLKLLLASVVAVCFSSIFNPDFAIVFAASCTVGLPVFWFFFFPPHLAATLLQRGRFGLGYVGMSVLLYAYFALSKKVLVPFVAGVIEHVFL